MKMIGPSLLLGFLLLAVQISAQTFVESSAEVGLSHRFQPSNRISGGLAVFDFDNDGDDDLYVPGGRNGDALFVNDGSGNFTELGEQYGIRQLTDSVVTISVVTGDIDNDGIREIFVGTYTGRDSVTFRAPNLLLKYDPASGTYRDIAHEAGLLDSSYAAGAIFFDANLDGWLDLYVTNYIETSGFLRDSNGVVNGFAHDCGPDHFYLNNGDGTFTDATDLLGGGNEGCGLAALASDTDNDGDQDLLLINDFGQWIQPDALYRNDFPDNALRNDEATQDFATRHYGMGIAAGDVNGDLLMDYYVTNIGTNAFLVNEGNNRFRRQEGAYRIKDEFTAFGRFTTGWGTFFADLNNDTYLDLFVGNGFVNSGVDVDDVNQSDKVFRGLASERFFDATPESGIIDTLTTRGAVYADLNGDGKLDVLVLTLAFPADPVNVRYYRNTTEDSGHYIAFRLSSAADNRDAYGSKVTLYAGGRAFVRELSAGGSHASQSTSLLHFGLGSIGAVDSVSVRWPSGRVGWLYGPAINQVHDIARGDLISSLGNQPERQPILLYPNPARDMLFVSGVHQQQPYSLLDATGRTLAQGNLLVHSSRISLPDLPPGIYFLRLATGAFRFVVE